MKIAFRTKEDANKEQEREFLALSGSERFYRFVGFIQQSKKLPSKAKKTKDKSFKIIIKTNR
ncbi:hypothetical protein [Maribacter aurantiacus]|uniref:Uncharacterized protein n=1 Tax=Maribacter aurantiacus TaxID=1882343 RepID=A0A5R8ME77_9FLAO|nr:hypothetical protein [Maribacter aurantiacus]TLF47039.1 hypothetical protein FEK29_04540 [Maribacter aurantiacus]